MRAKPAGWDSSSIRYALDFGSGYRVSYSPTMIGTTAYRYAPFEVDLPPPIGPSAGSVRITLHMSDGETWSGIKVGQTFGFYLIAGTAVMGPRMLSVLSSKTMEDKYLELSVGVHIPQPKPLWMSVSSRKDVDPTDEAFKYLGNPIDGHWGQ